MIFFICCGVQTSYTIQFSSIPNDKILLDYIDLFFSAKILMVHLSFLSTLDRKREKMKNARSSAKKNKPYEYQPKLQLILRNSIIMAAKSSFITVVRFSVKRLSAIYFRTYC